MAPAQGSNPFRSANRNDRHRADNGAAIVGHGGARIWSGAAVGNPASHKSSDRGTVRGRKDVWRGAVFEGPHGGVAEKALAAAAWIRQRRSSPCGEHRVMGAEEVLLRYKGEPR